MSMKNELKLPDGIEQIEISYLNYEHLTTIGLGYCSDCTKANACQSKNKLSEIIKKQVDYLLNPKLGSVIPEIPTLDKEFLQVKINTPYHDTKNHTTTMMCTEYSSPQQKILGSTQAQPDCIDRLVQLAEEEKQEYLQKIERRNLEKDMTKGSRSRMEPRYK